MTSVLALDARGLPPEDQCMPRDRYGLVLTTTSAEAADAYVSGVDLMLSGYPGADVLLSKAVHLDEGFALAHAALAMAEQEAGRAAASAHARSRAAELTGAATRREQQHVAATTLLAGARTRGDEARGVAAMCGHVAEFPRDAVVLGQLTGYLFFHGRAGKKARVLGMLEAARSAYGDDWWFSSRYAFHLQESFRYSEAVDVAERSLALRRANAYAAHALAHALYASHDHQGTHRFLQEWMRDYQPAGTLHGHLSWHLALLELDAGDHLAAWRVYERHVRPRATPGPKHLALADGASLLALLDAYGLSAALPGVAEAWEEVRQLACDVCKAPGKPFIDVFAGLAFAASGDEASLARLLDGLEACDPPDDGSHQVIAAAIRGIAEYRRAEFSRAVQHIGPVVEQLECLGGSNLERHLVEELLLDAQIHAGDHSAAITTLRARLGETPMARTHSWLARALVATGDTTEAAAHLRHARALWSDADPASPELEGIARLERSLAS